MHCTDQIRHTMLSTSLAVTPCMLHMTLSCMVLKIDSRCDGKTSSRCPKLNIDHHTPRLTQRREGEPRSNHQAAPTRLHASSRSRLTSKPRGRRQEARERRRRICTVWLALTFAWPSSSWARTWSQSRAWRSCYTDCAHEAGGQTAAIE